ncbi:metallophosphoesterase family protein [Nocardioides sp.]|uniref:purple acid phosphatase family protein n=1 Tax=Nocardioides sp. TaxID=35761 RepID=UPI002B273D20|nr:metallophosphoesterase family protein [Nocardioides sp.]
MTDTPPVPTEHTVPSLPRRHVLVGGAGAGLVAATSPMLWVPPAAAAARPRGVHLVYGDNARTSMTVSWSTPRSVAKSRLEIGPDRGLGLRVPVRSRSTKDLRTVYHHGTVEGLEPGTRYRYRITHRGAGATTGTFTTAPARAERFRFAAFGDMGVNAAAAAHVQLIDAMKPDLSFVVGDLCYADSAGGTGAGGDTSQDFAEWDRWLRQIETSAARVPWMTTVGNHEMEEGNGELGYAGYLDRFRNPRNGVKGAPVTYSFVYGNVAFIALDGNDASFEISRNEGYLGAAQDQWLERRLERFRARDDIDFIVVGFHNCMYCTNLVHASDGGNRTRWEPLFDRYSVDLVVNGHNHCYERTHPLRAGEPVVEARRGAVVDSRKGTTYLTAGGAGQAVYPTSGAPVSYVVMDGGVRVPETTHWSAVTDNQHSIGFVDVVPRRGDRPARMNLTALATDGTVIDKVTLKRGR